MRIKGWLLAIPIALSLAGAAGAVVLSFETFRTVAMFFGVTQGHDAMTGADQFDPVLFAGHTLVNLAMGRPVGDTTQPDQVFAMTFACDLSSANLVALDRLSGNTLATIAESASFDAIKAQTVKATAPDLARFVARFDVDPNGNGTDGITGGFLTVAGRVHLDQQTGCPQPVLLGLDHDPSDNVFGDRDLPPKADPDPIRDLVRTGQAHLIGVIDVVSNGTAHQVLVPLGRLSIRRMLPDLM